MSEKDFQFLAELLQKKLQEKVTKEEALRSLMRAGILDEAGNFTPPYTALAVPTSSSR